MAKEKRFRSGKKSRKKKSKEQKEPEGIWEQASRKKHHGKRKRHHHAVSNVQPNKKKKKKKYIWTVKDEEEWNLWNRARTSGVCYAELTCTVTIYSRKKSVLYEVNLNPDKFKIKMMKKEKNRRVLMGLLNRVLF